MIYETMCLTLYTDGGLNRCFRKNKKKDIQEKVNDFKRN